MIHSSRPAFSLLRASLLRDDGRIKPWAPLLTVIGVQMGTLLVVGSHTVDGFGLDDAWIFQTIARNFAETGVLGFNRGVVSSGATSILWTWLLSTNYAFFGWDPVLFTLILGSSIAVIGAVVFYEILKRELPPLSAAGAAAAAAGNGNWVWLAVSGMDAVLFVALGLACTLAVITDRRILSAVCAVLLVLARPEGIVWVFVLAIVWSARERRFSLLMPMLAIVTFAAVMFWSYASRGSLLPTTMAGRRWLSAASDHPVWSAGQLVVVWLGRLVTENGGHSIPTVLLSSAVCALAITGCRESFRARRGLLLLLAWAVVNLVVYAVMLPEAGHGGRYQAISLVLVGPLAVTGARVSSGPRHVRLVLYTLIALSSLISVNHWRQVAAGATNHLNSVHRTVGRWLFEHTAVDQPVAAFDIGAISFEMPGRRVVDLGGLVEREYLPYLEERRVAQYLREREVRIVALPEATEETPLNLFNFPVLLGAFDPQWRVERVFSRETPPKDWLWMFYATGNAFPRVSVYKIGWDQDTEVQLRNGTR